MKISPLNSISFKSIPLYNVKLKKQNSDGSCEELPATFSKLKCRDRKDKKLVKDIKDTWKGAEFTARICNDFLNNGFRKEDFYIIEGRNKKGEKEVYSIAEFFDFWNSIQFLQANPQNKTNGIKGAGEVMLWGIGQEKKEPMHDCFTLIPTSESAGFYEHAGLKAENWGFSLKASQAKKFFKRIEDKYNFSLEYAGRRHRK